MDADDTHLLLLTHRGNDAAARELWRRHAAHLMIYARSIVGERAAADIVQNVFVGLLRLSRAQVAAVRDPRSYFIVAVRRAAIAHERTRRRQLRRERGTLAQARARARQHDTPALALDIHAMLDRLPRRLREVIVLKHHSGLTFEQIAFALGANRNTVASRYQDAIRALRMAWDADTSVPHATQEQARIDPGAPRRIGGMR